MVRYAEKSDFEFPELPPQSELEKSFSTNTKVLRYNFKLCEKNWQHKTRFSFTKGKMKQFLKGRSTALQEGQFLINVIASDVTLCRHFRASADSRKMKICEATRSYAHAAHSHAHHMLPAWTRTRTTPAHHTHKHPCAHAPRLYMHAYVQALTHAPCPARTSDPTACTLSYTHAPHAQHPARTCHALYARVMPTRAYLVYIPTRTHHTLTLTHHAPTRAQHSCTHVRGTPALLRT